MHEKHKMSSKYILEYCFHTEPKKVNIYNFFYVLWKILSLMYKMVKILATKHQGKICFFQGKKKVRKRTYLALNNVKLS